MRTLLGVPLPAAAAEGKQGTADGGTTDQAPHKSLDDIRRELDAEFAPSATDGLDGPNTAERLASRPSTLPHLDKDEPPTPVPRREADRRGHVTAAVIGCIAGQVLLVVAYVAVTRHAGD